jgi:hypothetical protein
LVKETVHCISHGDLIVTHIPPQQSFLDKRVNFRLAYFDRKATKLLTQPISVQPHARSGRGASRQLSG